MKNGSKLVDMNEKQGNLFIHHQAHTHTHIYISKKINKLINELFAAIGPCQVETRNHIFFP